MDEVFEQVAGQWKDETGDDYYPNLIGEDSHLSTTLYSGTKYLNIIKQNVNKYSLIHNLINQPISNNLNEVDDVDSILDL